MTGLTGVTSADVVTGTFVTTTLVFRHQAQASASGEICGHHHPKAAIPARGGSVSRPCFVSDSKRIMMPAFGASPLLTTIVEHSRNVEQEAMEAEKRFVAMATLHGVERVAWHVCEGFVPEGLSYLSNWHDLLVLERRPLREQGLCPREPRAVVPSHPAMGRDAGRLVDDDAARIAVEDHRRHPQNYGPSSKSPVNPELAKFR